MLSSGMIGIAMFMLAEATNFTRPEDIVSMNLVDIGVSVLEGQLKSQLGAEYTLSTDIFEDGLDEYSSLDMDSVFYQKYTEKAAIDFVSRFDKATFAHLEYCRPDDWKMLYYDLNEQELSTIKHFLSMAQVDLSKNSGNADFTYTIHLFDEEGNYVYVVALNKDKKSMYVEPGGLVCDGLADLMVSLANLCEEK